MRQWFGSADPETGLAMRLLGTALLVANLILARPGGPPLLGWSVLLVAFAAWIFYVVGDPRWPVPAAIGLVAASALPTLLLGPTRDNTAVFAVCIPFAVLAAHIRVRVWVVVAVSVAEIAVAIAGLTLFGRGATEIVSDIAVLVVLGAFGLARRQYRIHAQQTQDLLVQTRLAQREKARAAALDERARIAREMHDVLAHSLGALSVQLDVAEALLSERGDVENALARVRRSRRLAVDGLAEARAAVAALRADIPPLADALTELAGAYARDHDVEVDFQTTGEPVPLSPAAEVSLLRTAREALTNAAKHAPGAPVAMTLAYADGWVRLVVRNPALAEETGNGYGLAGMRERIALLEGKLRAGWDGECWQVVAEVPV
ncbi:sensor histidine kinase [Fodinicola acaciae]|uniref:sensor histidine kinase n=1 Tax=Fodinicola acaciae TaxID=2681555 RepID=UPI0013D33A68|nr:histidine kinase [Fodinicola acaciae]